MKISQFRLKPLLILAIASFAYTSCSSDDDAPAEPDPIVEPLVLSCNIIEEEMILTDRGEGVDYIWPCFVKVYAPLIIEPGVTIAFEQGGGMHVQDYDSFTGSITAVGTADKPITFTGTNSTPGAWERILLTSGDLNNKFNHVILEFAGATDGSRAALYADNNSKIEIKNTIIRNNKHDGIFIAPGANIEGYQSNTIIGNQGYPMQIAARKVKFLDGAESIYADNGSNEVYVNSGSIYNRGFIEDEVNGPVHTWLNPGIPFFIDENIFVIHDRANEKPGHLRITEGCELIFAEEYGIQVRDGNTVFEALGTPDNNVVFSGQYGMGSWKGINLTQSNSSLNLIQNAIIADAGQSHWDWFDTPAALSLGDQTTSTLSFTLTNVHITNSGGCGIIERALHPDSSVSYNNVTFSNNVGNDICEE